MGSTITTGKRAAAYKDAAGNVWYSLFERTHESNCYPHTPEWSCIYFGALEGAIEKIFKHASSCEGGMLLGANKRSLKPENYITAWLRELSEPLEYEPPRITLSASASWIAPIDINNAERAYAILQRFGYDGIVDILKSGGAHDLNPLHDAPVIADLFGNKSERGPWRVIKNVPCEGLRNAGLGYKPQSASLKHPLDLPKVLKILPSEEGLLIQQPDASWKYGGWNYSVIAEFVNSIWQQELVNPGAYKVAIAAMRDAAKNARLMPSGTKLAIEDNFIQKREYLQRIVKRLAEHIAVRRTSTGYEFDVPSSPDLMRQMLQLPEESCRWILPEYKLNPCQEELALF